MSVDAAHDEASYVNLTARIEPALQSELERVTVESSRPGVKPNRSQTVRVLLWEALAARRSGATKAA